MTAIHQMLVLAATALALSTLPGRAGPCAQDIDRAWAQIDARIHARIAAGGQGWTPVEAAVAALARAREADQAGDRSACDQTLAQAQHAIEPTVLMSLPWP
jgi:hypothetical protein